MRAAIYARFSSDLQDERSITDQIAAARKYVETRGLTLTQTYQDAAISGASTLNRPSLWRDNLGETGGGDQNGMRRPVARSRSSRFVPQASRF